MQFKQSVLQLPLLLISFAAYSQTTYFPQGSRENYLLERMEIKAQKDSVLNFSKVKPFSRKQYVPVIEQYLAAALRAQDPEKFPPTVNDQVKRIDQVVASWTKVDRYNAEASLMNSPEWTNLKYKTRKPFLKTFYKSPAAFYEVDIPDFYLNVNPVFQYYLGKEKDNDEHIFLNTRGVSLRGRI